MVIMQLANETMWARNVHKRGRGNHSASISSSQNLVVVVNIDEEMKTIGDEIEELDKEIPPSNNTRGITQEYNYDALPTDPFKRARQSKI
ncbi:hypothetical protein V6N11_039432 [Hibiscus sabdariffa]|uniref:Uncharacterized protein n=1 Tax=Hibiscus sabdariffa TaxID=183260 RepID=A0ABR2SN74_9ROSI